jgi:mycofactocin precursor
MSEPRNQGPLLVAEAAIEAETLEVVVDEALVEADLLVEDVSIDGMCGVY